jgi:hypothetical protein
MTYLASTDCGVHCGKHCIIVSMSSRHHRIIIMRDLEHRESNHVTAYIGGSVRGYQRAWRSWPPLVCSSARLTDRMFMHRRPLHERPVLPHIARWGQA